MKALLAPLFLLAFASCTSLAETRWAADADPEAPSQGTIAKAAEHPISGFYHDDVHDKAKGRTKSDAAGALALVSVDALPEERKAAGDTDQPKDRKMVYSASLQVRVSSIEDAVQRLLARVRQLEGYLALRNNNVLTCRIPAGSFTTLVEEVKGYGVVLQESMQAQDVTKQHVDLTIRLENAETARKRLLSLLEKATKVEDILKIEEQLTRLTETIERIKGELKYLNEQIAYSLVSVGFQSSSPSTTPRRRARSRFDWINQVGIEQVLRRF